MRKAQARPLGVHPGNRFYTQRRESFFFDYVKQELIDRYGVEEVRRAASRSARRSTSSSSRPRAPRSGTP